MLPFDRLITQVDQWAARNVHTEVYMQIGDGLYEPKAAEWVRTMSSSTYRQILKSCELFVAHVGMGSILQAIEFGRPAILMPRKARLGEHVNDHQLDTASRFEHRFPSLRIVYDEKELGGAISETIASPSSATPFELPRFASPSMITNIRSFLSQ